MVAKHTRQAQCHKKAKREQTVARSEYGSKASVSWETRGALASMVGKEKMDEHDGVPSETRVVVGYFESMSHSINPSNAHLTFMYTTTVHPYTSSPKLFKSTPTIMKPFSPSASFRHTSQGFTSPLPLTDKQQSKTQEESTHRYRYIQMDQH